MPWSLVSDSAAESTAEAGAELALGQSLLLGRHLGGSMGKEEKSSQ